MSVTTILEDVRFEALKGDIYNVWQEIGGDVPPPHSNEVAVELCVDCNRLSSFGYPESQQFFSEIVEELGVDDAYKLVAEQLYIF